MNELQWFNKVSYIMVNLRANEKEVSIYNKRVRITLTDVSNDVLRDDLHFIAHTISLYKGSELDVEMHAWGHKNRLRLYFDFRSNLDKLLGRYARKYDSMP